MTLPTKVKQWLIDKYGASRSTVAPNPVHVTAMCMMQFVKGSLPESVITVRNLVDYLIHKMLLQIKRQNGCSVVIACFDIETVPVKAIIEYEKRKEWRCKECRKGTWIKCTRKGTKCKDKPPLKFEDGPHLPLNDDHRLPVTPDQWMRFASDSRNLRYELYPRLMNALLTRPEFLPGTNQTIIVSGLPCDSELISAEHARWEFGYCPSKEEERRLLKPWKLDSMHLNFKNVNDPDRFKRVYRIQNVNGVIYRHEVPEMKHSIPEADSSIFYFTKFFPNANFLYSINDGDALSIGLLRVMEDFHAGECKLKRYVALPRRRALKPGEHNWSHEYFDMVHLKQLIEEDPVYTAAGVSNHVATVVFLIILAGTDFFKNFCPYIGYKTDWNEEDEKKRAKQSDGIWDTFHKRLPMFRHMVQWNIFDMIPDPNVKRRIVLDEDLFKLFVLYCYFHSYEKDPDSNKIPDFEAIRVKCSKFKQKARHMPSDEQILLWARHLTWNLDYWVNSFRDIYVDPFMEIDGKSYYGFCNGKVAATNQLSLKQEPIDEQYKRNLYKRKQKQEPLKRRGGGIIEERKRNAIDAIKGKI